MIPGFQKKQPRGRRQPPNFHLYISSPRLQRRLMGERVILLNQMRVKSNIFFRKNVEKRNLPKVTHQTPVVINDGIDQKVWLRWYPVQNRRDNYWKTGKIFTITFLILLLAEWLDFDSVALGMELGPWRRKVSILPFWLAGYETLEFSNRWCDTGSELSVDVVTRITRQV